MFDSVLPANIDKNEVNKILRITRLAKQLLADNWETSDAFDICPISDISIEYLRCLHEDLIFCFRKAFVFNKDGEEDRCEEYRLIREYLFSKYKSIDEDILKSIYSHYLILDR